MNKIKLYKIWKDLWIDDNIIKKIVVKVTGMSKSQLFLCEEIDEKYVEDIKELFNRLLTWEPIEYIINNAEFYWLDFFVDNRVLIPRNDTEIMVQETLKELKKWKSEKYILIDVWTWSWCICISIANNCENIDKFYAIDISKEALEVARKNINRYELEDKILLINWNLLDFFIDKNPLNNNIIITANLPYIKNNDSENMDPQTIKYEPQLALYWWKINWFELYEKIINQVLSLKKIYKINNIKSFIEIWFDQKKICEDYLTMHKLKFKIYKDNSWINRCVKIIY